MENSLHLSSRKSSTAISFAALKTPVIVPPARPALYDRSMEGYFSWSGFLKVRFPILQFNSAISDPEGTSNSNLKIKKSSQRNYN